MGIEQYQMRILKPDEIIDYSSLMMQSYTPENLRLEPMIGFKVMLKDLNCYALGSQAARFQQIEQNLRFLLGTGCVIRETHPTESQDGFWLITFPTPTSHITRQIQTAIQVVNLLSDKFGIISTPMTEINVSGHCPVANTEASMMQITLPPTYSRFMVEPSNSAYKLGHTIRISDEYLLLRTMWNFGDSPAMNDVHLSDLMVISQILTGMFRC